MKTVTKLVALVFGLFLAVTSALAQTQQPMRSQVGSYNNWTDTFGYTSGALVYRPMVGLNKTVTMTERVVTLSYECTGITPTGVKPAIIIVTAAVNPSLLWETDYHRLTSIYGALGTKGGDKNVVNHDDIMAGVTTYVGQHQEALCTKARAKTVRDFLVTPDFGAAVVLNDIVKMDKVSPWDIKVQTVRVDLPKEYLAALALKALEPKPAPKKPIAHRTTPRC